eukprot:210326_1
MLNSLRLLLLVVEFHYLVDATPSDFDCPMRQLLLEYSQEINPALNQRQLQEIADALNGSPLGKFYDCNVKPQLSQHKTFNYTHTNTMNPAASIYVDIKRGNDKLNDGLSINSPFQTLQKAIKTARELFGSNKFKQILLRRGTYYISSTIYLTHLDSNLLIKSYQYEDVNISGAIPLNNLNWRQSGTKNGHQIYETTIPNNINITDIYGLRINGYRGIRARYPNVQSEETYPPETYSQDPKQWLTTVSNPTHYYVYNTSMQWVRTYDNPAATFMPGGYQYYNLELGGNWQGKFLPPGSPPRFSYLYITGLEYNKQVLPNAPYKDPTGAIVRAFMQLHWNSWMWEVDPARTSNTRLMFYDSGGMQGSQGGTGDTFYIENVMEELDAINEWFYDRNARKLYYIPNGTDFRNYKYDAVKLKILIEHIGTRENPVRNVNIDGVNIIDTAYTFMDPHGVPSAGDWSFQYNGAINF